MRINKSVLNCRRYAVAVVIAACVMCGMCSAESIPLNDLSAWRGPTNQWVVAGDVSLSAQNEKLLVSKPGRGIMVNGPTGRTRNILTKEEFGDVQLRIEFMVPKGSNSGVYLMGRYEIQVFDSWQVEEPHHSDCGGIYQRWRNNRGFEGRPPKVNASKAPGQWQSFDAVFRAPKFDVRGNKIANARFVEVKHNGIVVHEGVEVTGPTRAATYNDEKATGPLMLQGDHGPVAYRNITITPLPAEKAAPAVLKALIVDGQNNHNWKATTPVLKRLLEETGLFVVDVATTPSRGQPMEDFRPDFAKYDVVVSNYTGDEWPAGTKKAFEEYIAGGGGLVVYHAASNAFPKWKEWNEMIALGGWGGRNEKSGPMVRFRDGRMVLDYSPGRGGSHGPQHEFQIVTRSTDHPITAGLPEKWMHAKDELYSTLRGPAKNITLLATAFADKEKRGSGENEPILFTVSYGKGRIFHTVLGHATEQLKCVGFIFTFQRGAEWAASGRVTQTNIPDDFPTADAVSLRTKSNAKLPADYGKEIITWQFDKDRQALAVIEEDIRNAMPQRLLAIEAVLVEALNDPKCTYAGKQWVCRMLRRMGSAQSVPALAKMLADKKLSHMARFALQYMPAPEAGAALREALGKLDGDLKIGIVGSLGLRGDRQAVAQIIPLMKSDNKMMAQAAIKALSHIGGRQAGMALSRTEVAQDLQMLKDDAVLMCADNVLAGGMTDLATSIYTPMTAKNKPVFIRIAAYRGLVRAQKEKAVPTIVALLKDDNVDLQRAAGKFIVEMPGTEATKSFASQLQSLPAATQVILISALESRNDKAAAPALARAARSGNSQVRTAAVGALASLGDASSIPLLAALSTDDSDLGKEAMKSLARLSGEGVGAALIKAAEGPGDAAVRSNIIEVLVARRETDALGSFVKLAADRNGDVRSSIYKALGTLGGRDELAKVVGMLTANKDSSERGALERALNSIAARLGPDDAEAVIAGLPRADTDVRARLLGVLSRLGGNEALAAVRYYLKRSEGEVRKAAIRAMAAWGDPAPLEDLLAAAKTESDASMQIIALRGYIQLASRPANRSAANTVKLLARGLAAARRADEKKAVLAALPRVACDEAMKLARSCSADKTLAGEAALAVKKIKETLINKKLRAGASRDNASAKNALDGNAGTRWTTGRGMKPGDWFMIDLGVEDVVKKITLDTRNSANDYPRGYEVFTSFDGGNWGKAVLTGKGTNPITVLEFDKPVRTRYIKIVQTGSSDSWHWSIHKLNIEFE